ncbi:MAG: hypothetical protein KGM43_10170, partial [Planctomycetota bacterium]|nr:hypothetical protein [Planctomycetota bacterium]
ASARYVGPVTLTAVSVGPGAGTTTPQLAPATGYGFWWLGLGVPILNAPWTVTDSVVGTATISNPSDLGGSWTGNLSYNYPGVVGGCSPAAAVEVVYEALATSSGGSPAGSWPSVPWFSVAYNQATGGCPLGGAYRAGPAELATAATITLSPLSVVFSNSSFTPPAQLYTTAGTIAVTD